MQLVKTTAGKSFKKKISFRLETEIVMLEGAREKSDSVKRAFLRSAHNFAKHADRWRDRHVFTVIFTAGIYM